MIWKLRIADHKGLDPIAANSRATIEHQTLDSAAIFFPVTAGHEIG